MTDAASRCALASQQRSIWILHGSPIYPNQREYYQPAAIVGPANLPFLRPLDIQHRFSLKAELTQGQRAVWPGVSIQLLATRISDRNLLRTDLELKGIVVSRCL